jgi:hypothetical protein
MRKPVWIAGTIGLLVGVFWLAFWMLPIREVQLHPGRLATLATITCPPLYLQFTVLAPFLNAGLYAVVAVVWMKVKNQK